MNRNYVIVCNNHEGILKDALLFWGHYTKNTEQRSYGGYTQQFDKCEKYTKVEIESCGYDFEYYKKYTNIREYEGNVYAKIDDLRAVGYRTLNVMIN